MNKKISDTFMKASQVYSSCCKSAKSFFLPLLMLLAASIVLSSCSEKTEPYMGGRGYFKVPRTKTLTKILSPEEGELEIPLEGKESETVIPIVVISVSSNLLANEKMWNDYEKYGWLLQTDKVYQAAGYSSYPNTLDMKYQLDWVKCSSYKESNSIHGVLKVKYDKNTTDKCRFMTIYLENEDEGFLDLIQMPEDGTGVTKEYQPE